MKKAELVRAIQKAKGREECFGTGKTATCGQSTVSGVKSFIGLVPVLETGREKGEELCKCSTVRRLD